MSKSLPDDSLARAGGGNWPSLSVVDTLMVTCESAEPLVHLRLVVCACRMSGRFFSGYTAFCGESRITDCPEKWVAVSIKDFSPECKTKKKKKKKKKKNDFLQLNAFPSIHAGQHRDSRSTQACTYGCSFDLGNMALASFHGRSPTSTKRKRVNIFILR